MNGAPIEENPHPLCATRRTVWFRTASFCFICGLCWASQSRSVSGASVEPCLEPPCAFAAAATPRLVMYRAAIHAGFYNDQ